MILDRDFVVRVLPEAVWIGCPTLVLDRFVLDSRNATAGAIFVALKGERVDGHDFVRDALAHGAKGFLVATSQKEKVVQELGEEVLGRVAVVFVAQVQDALIALAAAWRAQFDVPVIGITGSLGKTSTKEMLATIIKNSGKDCLVTMGNQNTLLSVATALLNLRSSHDCAVIEMGTSKRGEMAQLAHLVRPTTAIITSVAHSHMEGLGSLQDIALEKRDIFKYFNEKNIGIINGDQDALASISYSHPVVRVGCKTTNQVQARKIVMRGMQTSCILKLYGKKYSLVIKSLHTGRIYSALASAAAAHFLGIPHTCIIEGIEQALLVPGRFQPRTLRRKNGLLIDDCYNANPESMKEALLAFERIETAGKKIAVLGDMLELGVNAPFWHRQLGRALRKVPSLDSVIFVGKLIKAAEETIPHGVEFATVSTWQEAALVLEQQINLTDSDPTILVKGSNSVGLKNLVAQFVTEQES